MRNNEQIEAKRRERFEIMAVRLAKRLEMSHAETFDQLPVPIRKHMEGLRYCDIVRPLIQADHADGYSLRRLAIKYGLSKTAISNHISK